RKRLIVRLQTQLALFLRSLLTRVLYMRSSDIYNDPPGIPISQSSPRGIGHLPSVVVYDPLMIAGRLSDG
mgnify:CR=1